MNVALYVVQGLLALTFLASGVAKVSMSKERMIASGQTGVAPFPLPVIRVVAALEIAGAVALVLPWVTDIWPVLTPTAAVGFALLMIGAGISHTSLGELRVALVVNLSVALLAVFVAAGRGLPLLTS